MLHLVDLHPEWFAEPGRRGQGVTFDCPCCEGRVRLAVAFANPLDGGAPASLTPRDLWPLLWPRPDAIGRATVPPGCHWQRTGDTFETLTLVPSVDASRSGHWHGHISAGVVR